MEIKSDKEQFFGRVVKSIASFLHKRFIFTFVFVEASAVWLPLLFTLLGSNFGLLSTKDDTFPITWRGAIFLILYAIFILICRLSLHYEAKINNSHATLKNQLNEEREAAAVWADLNKSGSIICENKLRTLTACLDTYLERQTAEPPEIISNPQSQLDSIADEISTRMEHLLKIDQRKQTDQSFYTSIIYRFPQENSPSWHCATMKKGLTIEELLTEKDGYKSTFLHLLNKRGHTVFFNSKQTAYEKKCYIPDDEDFFDDDDKLMGSIACFRYNVMNRADKVLVDFVITITSYHRKFVENESNPNVINTIRDNIIRVFMPGYVMRAKIELCLLYMKYLKEKNKTERKTVHRIKGVSSSDPSDKEPPVIIKI